MVLLLHFRFGFGRLFTENRGFGFSWFQFLHEIWVKQTINCKHKYKLLCPRGTQTCALAVANMNVNGNGKVILDTHPESDQHQN